MKSGKDIIVFYHSSCPDGFGAAWAAWKKFGNDASYVALSHTDPFPDEISGKEVYFLDIVLKGEKMKQALDLAKKVVVVDHHVTDEENTRMAKEHVYDLEHSGSVLAWKYFHPGKDVPKLLLHIEDFDLWKFDLPHTEEVDVFLDSFEFDFSLWDSLAEDFEDPEKYEKRIGEGRTLMRLRDKLVHEAASNAYKVVFAGHEIYAVNAEFFHSQIGHALYEAHPPMAIIWRVKKDGSTKVSLRSDGSVDVGKIAKGFGGGGHKGSSGFSVPPGKEVPWAPVKEEI